MRYLFLILFVPTVFAAECRQNLDLIQNQMVTGSNLRTFDTFALLYGSVKEPNVVYSGLSLNAALTMIAYGAVGESQAEIMRFLRLQFQRLDYVDTAWERLLYQLTSPPSETMKVHVGNSLWTNSQRFRYSSSFLNARNGAAFSGNFHEPKTLEAIHAWLREVTDSEPLVNELSPFTASLLLSTLYFKAPWQHPFAKTKLDVFTAAGDKPTEVVYMHEPYLAADYLDNANYQMISLPLGPRAVMDVVLPHRGTSMTGFVELFRQGAYETAIKRLSPAVVDFRLPKFRIDAATELRPLLHKFGINRLFVPGQAELHLMGQYHYDGPIGINSILQKVNLLVNEFGIYQGESKTTPRESESTASSTQMHVDRPFLFILRDRPSNAVLLHGVIGDPTR